MFKGKTVYTQRLEDGLFEICFDREASVINKLDKLAMRELLQAATSVAAEPGLRGVLITSSKDAFIVGADITEFLGMFAGPAAEMEAIFAESMRAPRAVEDLPVPTVVAINGLALGGGLEMALAADFRVMATTAQIGFPEVKLGLIPGFGGTVRLPRVAGAQLAIDWITGGASSNAQAALASGVVDEVAPRETLRDAALTLLKKAIAGEADWRARRARKLAPMALPAEQATALFTAAKEKVAKRGPKHQPAALAAVELMQRSVSEARDAAERLETTTFVAMSRTQAANSLVQIFLSDQLLKKKAKDHAKQGRPMRQAAVLGAGIMGGGISYVSALRGTPVLMKDIRQEQLDLGVAESKKLLAKQVASGKLDQDRAATVMSAIKPQLDYKGFDKVDIVVEAVVESLKVKHAVLTEVEKLVRADAIIASNTSSLRIDDLAVPLQRPENFVGMHFFNPVPLMPLVEIIRGRKTSEVAVSTVVAYAAAMGKAPIVVNDGPGFLVNRILTPYMLAFLQLIAEGADFVEVDQVMERFGWPMGPAYLNDVIGMDTGTHVFTIIADGFPQRLQRQQRDALHLMVEGKRLGQKTGLGFYKYEADAAGKPSKTPAPDTHALLKQVQPQGTRKFQDQEIVERMMLPMIAEAAWCIEENVVATVNELDMALLMGLGMPQYLGGALKYADWLGLSKVVELSDRYAALGRHYVVPQSLRAKAAAGERYYR
ncbi:MAG TPA: fatty acid oxidation complex subunit alpha FadB [Steroidobacteraceae bacterium]